MSEWKECRIGNIVKSNKNNLSSDFKYQWITYLDTGSITNGKVESYQKLALNEAPSRAKRLVEDKDIVYSLVRPIQKHFGIINNPPLNMVVSTGFSVLSVNSNLAEYKFVYYFLTSKEIVEELDVLAEASTTTYPSIKPIDIENLIIYLPSLFEQKAIASVLSSLDDKIDLLNRQNKTLEALAETLFRQWFIEDNKDFKIGFLSSFIENTISGDWGVESLNSNNDFEVYCLRGTDISAFYNDFPHQTPKRFINTNKFKSKEINEGDIIMEISGGTETQSTGRTFYINNEIKLLFNLPLCFSNFCRLLRVKNKKYTYYLYLFLRYLYNNDEFFSLENGTSGIKNLNYKYLLNELEFKLPNDDLIFKFDKTVNPFFNKINKNKLHIQKLENLRDTLLPKLMSGEVRVKYE